MALNSEMIAYADAAWLEAAQIVLPPGAVTLLGKAAALVGLAAAAGFSV